MGPARQKFTPPLVTVQTGDNIEWLCSTRACGNPASFCLVVPAHAVPWTSSTSITQELVKNANSHAQPHIYWVRNSGVRLCNLHLTSLLGVALIFEVKLDLLLLPCSWPWKGGKKEIRGKSFPIKKIKWKLLMLHILFTLPWQKDTSSCKANIVSSKAVTCLGES